MGSIEVIFPFFAGISGLLQLGAFVLACHFYAPDNWAGFVFQYSNELFGVFQRLYRSEDYGGTAVGLGIVQRIILRHGGRKWGPENDAKVEGRYR